jgi:hypothetical protein
MKIALFNGNKDKEQKHLIHPAFSDMNLEIMKRKY